MDEWKALPWKKLQRTVFRLQKRIYQASLRGDSRQVRQLQKLLSKSRAAKLLAVRKVTQDNQGKRTAGIDGVKSLTDTQRLRLSRQLSFRCAAKPLRRVWIPKPGSTEKRPLGIPVMRDRALQALVKLALEPEWEARFEPNSYGFRPGRSAHDAIGAIYNCINQRAKWVLDADIEKCFDRIDHERLLAKVATMPLFRRLLNGWLRAGVLDGDVFQPVEAGTPQGGVISPLLANIALHGMETVIQTHFRQRRISRTRLSPKVTLIRYADDFVVLHEDRHVVEACRQVLADWLAPLGLAMKPAKTRVVHTLHHAPQQAAGFDFLGMTVRQFPVGRTHSGKSPRGIPLGYKTLIKPSRTAQQRHDRRLGEIVYRQRGSPQAALIRELNPVIRGWCAYYAGVVAKDVFSRLDYTLHHKLRRWATRRHSGRHTRRIVHKYWRLEQGSWKFNTPEGVRLHTHSLTRIKRHVKVAGSRSPFDGRWTYWGARLRDYHGLSRRTSALLKRQAGRCGWCKLYFTDTDVLEQDHRVPRIRGGKEELANLQLLHRHCHDQKTRQDGSMAARSSGAQRGAV
ncbi:group II intron reverse transcriptase/maturase (plasmid) [Hymenobacter sp. NBH84]|uniref:group II intron reverse transcriptase/maturase n=1 Tax=Hymenobacter sp. NBH84 TaxID=2596915 RepID=UPI00185FB6DC|nr:group II intron reverse transcriptase/maturase [Hymenobacter sp. NBH84]QNE42047.1 group II intron reverse transcriptase/maturase [Hymenobacter sp. NBH84]